MSPAPSPTPAPGPGWVRRFFALDDDWVRPTPPIAPRDVLVVAVVEGLGLLFLELTRSVGYLEHTSGPRWVQWLAVSLGTAPLLFRRRFPLSVAVVATAHLFVVGVTMPAVMNQFSLQVAYFLAYFSAFAWGRDRRSTLLVVGALVTLMFVWIAWQIALGSAIDDIVASTSGTAAQGPFTPVVATVLSMVIVNVVYFFGASVAGQLAWRAARQQARMAEQARTIASQADHLRRQAVVDERLRIARELHDAVGHHVSVIGVQAGAARRVLDKDPTAAKSALASVEESSRSAVTQMRGLLGTLRSLESQRADTAQGPTLTPDPGLSDLPVLVAEANERGPRAAFTLVESSKGASMSVPPNIGLTLYRVAQEALANVAAHSTARAAAVVVRVDTGRTPYAEIEVTDDGRARQGTSGSGLGHLGMRERAASHGGVVEIGPRVGGGYRVRVRLPLGAGDV